MPAGHLQAALRQVLQLLLALYQRVVDKFGQTKKNPALEKRGVLSFTPKSWEILGVILFFVFGHFGSFFKYPFHPAFIFHCSAPWHLFRFAEDSFRGGRRHKMRWKMVCL